MIKERSCTQHKHPGGANMVLRYESEDAICPLCAAMEGNDPTDGGKEAVVTAEAKQHRAETECKKYKAESDEHWIESAKQKKHADTLENEIVGPLKVKLKKAEEALEALGDSDKDGLILKLQDHVTECQKSLDEMDQKQRDAYDTAVGVAKKQDDEIEEQIKTIVDHEQKIKDLIKESELAKQDCEEKNALIKELKEKLEKAETETDTDGQ